MKKHNILSALRPMLGMVALVALSTVITSCAETVNTRGQVILPSRLAQVHAGVSKKEDVLQLLGSPSTQGTMNDNRWYYITSSVATTSFSPHILKSRQVVIIDFAPDGTVANITQKDKADGKSINPDEDVTPTHGQALGIVDQLLGNLGGLVKN